MKILLVYPTRLDRFGNPVKYKKAFLPPLSLAILNGLTPDHHQVHVVNDIVEEVDFSASYDLVGITAMTTQIGRAYQIADRFRARGVKVVIGGIHATVLPEEAKEHGDSVVAGEADDLWEDILEDFERGREKEFYRAAAYPDLQRQILPKWDNFNFSIYPRPFGNAMPKMPLFTTRGCVFNCKFCSVSKYFGKSYRFKPIGHVLTEIEQLKARDFTFVDDNIVCNPDYSRELFRALAGKNIRWFSQISTTVLKTPELIALAAKGGCKRLFVGIESINPAALRSVRKGFNKTEQYEELFARFREAGIKPYPSVIFGFDEDGPDQLRLTVEFLTKNKIDTAFFWILTPLPGTKLHEEMEDQGRILSRDWSRYNLNEVVFRPVHFTPEQLSSSYWEAFQDFYSARNIARRLLNGAPGARRTLQSRIRSLFYQLHFRKNVSSHDHPLSGGIGRIKAPLSRTLRA